MILQREIKHMQCFCQFRYGKDAKRAVEKLNSRWFNGRPIHAEMSPVTDFREACCRQYEMGFVLSDFIGLHIE